MNCEYIRNYYGVPAEIGRRVIVDGKPGIIAEDGGNYIGVNFDADKPGKVFQCHPTWRVVYDHIGTVRPASRSQQRYKRFLEYGDSFEGFLDYCRWDSEPERSWNK